MSKVNEPSVREIFAGIGNRIVTLGHGDNQIYVCGENKVAEQMLSDGRLNIVMAHQVIAAIEKENPEILEKPMSLYIDREHELLSGSIPPMNTDHMNTNHEMPVSTKKKCCKGNKQQ